MDFKLKINYSSIIAEIQAPESKYNNRPVGNRINKDQQPEKMKDTKKDPKKSSSEDKKVENESSDKELSNSGGVAGKSMEEKEVENESSDKELSNSGGVAGKSMEEKEVENESSDKELSNSGGVAGKSMEEKEVIVQDDSENIATEAIIDESVILKKYELKLFQVPIQKNYLDIMTVEELSFQEFSNNLFENFPDIITNIEMPAGQDHVILTIDITKKLNKSITTHIRKFFSDNYISQKLPRIGDDVINHTIYQRISDIKSEKYVETKFLNHLVTICCDQYYYSNVEFLRRDDFTLTLENLYCDDGTDEGNILPFGRLFFKGTDFEEAFLKYALEKLELTVPGPQIKATITRKFHHAIPCVVKNQNFFENLCKEMYSTFGELSIEKLYNPELALIIKVKDTGIINTTLYFIHKTLTDSIQRMQLNFGKNAAFCKDLDPDILPIFVKNLNQSEKCYFVLSDDGTLICWGHKSSDSSFEEYYEELIIGYDEGRRHIPLGEGKYFCLERDRKFNILLGHLRNHLRCRIVMDPETHQITFVDGRKLWLELFLAYYELFMKRLIFQDLNFSIEMFELFKEHKTTIINFIKAEKGEQFAFVLEEEEYEKDCDIERIVTIYALSQDDLNYLKEFVPKRLEYLTSATRVCEAKNFNFVKFFLLKQSLSELYFAECTALESMKLHHLGLYIFYKSQMVYDELLNLLQPKFSSCLIGCRKRNEGLEIYLSEKSLFETSETKFLSRFFYVAYNIENIHDRIRQIVDKFLLDNIYLEEVEEVSVLFPAYAMQGSNFGNLAIKRLQFTNKFHGLFSNDKFFLCTLKRQQKELDSFKGQFNLMKEDEFVFKDYTTFRKTLTKTFLLSYIKTKPELSNAKFTRTINYEYNGIDKIPLRGYFLHCAIAYAFIEHFLENTIYFKLKKLTNDQNAPLFTEFLECKYGFECLVGEHKGYFHINLLTFDKNAIQRICDMLKIISLPLSIDSPLVWHYLITKKKYYLNSMSYFPKTRPQPKGFMGFIFEDYKLFVDPAYHWIQTYIRKRALFEKIETKDEIISYKHYCDKREREVEDVAFGFRNEDGVLEVCGPAEIVDQEYENFETFLGMIFNNEGEGNSV